MRSWQPLCQTCSPGAHDVNGSLCAANVCERGGRAEPCGRFNHGKGFSHTTGAWKLDASVMYFLDEGLAAGLARHFGSASVAELGAGIGCYTTALSALGVNVSASDGSPDAPRCAHPHPAEAPSLLLTCARASRRAKNHARAIGEFSWRSV